MNRSLPAVYIFMSEQQPEHMDWAKVKSPFIRQMYQKTKHGAAVYIFMLYFPLIRLKSAYMVYIHVGLFVSMGLKRQ